MMLATAPAPRIAASDALAAAMVATGSAAAAAAAATAAWTNAAGEPCRRVIENKHSNRDRTSPKPACLTFRENAHTDTRSTWRRRR
jgi:fructose-1,6-bisphosphatase/inositol monophosphatase family enzyme